MPGKTRWDPSAHPRGPIGRFVSVPGATEHRAPYNLRARQRELVADQSHIGDLGYTPDPEIDGYYSGSNGFPLIQPQRLTRDQRDEVDDYVRQGAEINQALRSTQGALTDSRTRALDSAIDAHPLQMDTTVYRGVRIGLLADVQPGDQIHDWAYSSTALDPGNTRLFGGDMMEIELPAGTGALMPWQHGVQHKFGTASEMIIGRGAVFEVISKEKLPDGDDPIVGPFVGHRVVRARLVGYVEVS